MAGAARSSSRSSTTATRPSSAATSTGSSSSTSASTSCVAELSGSTTLGTLLRQLSAKIEWLYALDAFSRGKRLWPDHRRILAAVDAGDVDRAAELMGWHVRESRLGYLSRTAPREVVDELRSTPPVVVPSAAAAAAGRGATPVGAAGSAS